jgi:hypothetical protein
MQQVPFCSAKLILGRVARNTGGKLPSMFHDDILEWISEGIDLLSNNNSIEITSTPDDGQPKALQVENHVVCIPKDCCGIIAIEDEYGRILPLGGDVTDLRSTSKSQQTGPNEARPSVWQTDGTPVVGNTTPIFGEDLQPVTSTNRSDNYYKISGSYIQTSFECGYIKVHYQRRPVDKEGYPMIPDLENFKQSLYWYVLKQLIGAGYEHKVFTYGQCDEEFEKYGQRAINELNYPSLDAAARANRATVRLIPPSHFYEDFFTGSEQVQEIRK